MDYIKICAEYTGTDVKAWAYAPGPDSGVGIDYWLRGPEGYAANVNVDQTSVQVILLTYDGDDLINEEVIFSAETA